MSFGESASSPLSFSRRLSLRLRIFYRSLKEYLLYDSTPFKSLVGYLGCLVGFSLYFLRLRRKGFGILSKVHRGAFAELPARAIERLMREASRKAKEGKTHPLHEIYTAHIRDAYPTPHAAKFFEDPEKMLRGNSIVLKSPGANERGVLCLYYTYIYQYFAKFFDLDKIMEKYYLVIEPSWSGYCDLNIAFFTLKKHPVFVGSIEPRDTRFIQSLSSNLIPVSFSSNTWVDSRVYRPLPNIDKDIDFLMVAGWGEYKRHWAFFSALHRLRIRGVNPKVGLVGYPLGATKQKILQLAEYYGVRDLIEIHERLPPDEVNLMYNRAKVNVLWSRREGVNRTIIEGMFAGVSCLVREGFNFGYRYPHINQQTGCYSSERDLPDKLLEMMQTYQSYSPREWVMENMTCQRSTTILNHAIKAKALELGETWTRDLVAKMNVLHGMAYWDPADEKQFHADIDFLCSARVRQSIG